ncbi:MAG: hypothetical protein JXX29_22555, partial [Deltaproteobacteria bacterium]|nr:hypothetical protein [Deltaproteobacteria bacterium]
YGMASGGMVFSPKGASASRTGGFQLKLPVLVDLGFMTGELEAGDGFRDNINWLLIGPSSGVDLIWWKANKLGIIVSFKLGIQARIDMNSSYADEPYSSHRDNYANLDTALTLGFII